MKKTNVILFRRLQKQIQTPETIIGIYINEDLE